MSAPVSDLVARAKAATMRFDWGDLPDDAAIPAVPLLRELAARITELEAALAPFAEIGELFQQCSKDDMHVVSGTAPLGDRFWFTVADFRRARTLLAGGKRDGS